jgi:Lon protease-like protein
MVQPDWEVLPVLSVGSGVLFPGMRCSVILETVRAYGAVRESTRDWGEKALAVCACRPGSILNAAAKDLHTVGALARVVGLRKLGCCGRWIANLCAVGRIRTRGFLQEDPFRLARVERLSDLAEDDLVLSTLTSAVRETAASLAERLCRPAQARATELRLLAEPVPAQVVGIALELLSDIDPKEQQGALELPRLSARLKFALDHLQRRISDTGPPSGASRPLRN